MLNWIQRAVTGTLTCFFCGGLVIQMDQGWVCENIHCEKHVDEPAGRQQGFIAFPNGSHNPVASGTASTYTFPGSVITTGTTAT